MKKVSILFLSIIIFSCQNQNGSVDISGRHAHEKVPAIQSFIFNFLVENLNCFNNDITIKECRQKFTFEAYSFLTNDTIDFIREVEFEFEGMVEYPDGDYVVKFTHGKYSKTKKITNQYDLSLQVFAKIKKDLAIKLMDQKIYMISGKFKDFANQKSFVLPSGRTFTDYPDIYIDPYDKISVSLGTLIIDSLSFRQVNYDY